ncbi:MAG: hypothetical protein IPP04_03260 [Saprospiraceae bacterium]|nr:hypothetical protein [Saprospiraceae bacterium]
MAYKRKVTAIIGFHDTAAMNIIQYLKSIKKDKQYMVVSCANFPMTLTPNIQTPAATVEQCTLFLQGQNRCPSFWKS